MGGTFWILVGVIAVGVVIIVGLFRSPIGRQRQGSDTASSDGGGTGFWSSGADSGDCGGGDGGGCD